MAQQTVSRTALGAVVCRLIEQYQPESNRLFVDPVAKEMVGGTIRLMMGLKFMRNFTAQQTDAVAPGIYGAQICRTRCIDDVVVAALAQGIQQVVILGAGYDTRPYRLAGIEKAKVFEVDLATVQNDKKAKLRKLFGRLPENVTFIPIDFDRQTLESVFTGSAFDFSKPAVFVWEGVTQYITEGAVRQTLEFVQKSAPGSVIVFTYVLKSIIEGTSNIPGAAHIMETVAKSSPWIFGLDPKTVADFLKPYGLDVVADVGNADYQTRYLKPLGRCLVVTEAERIVQATRSGS